MNTPREGAIAEAMAALGGATGLDDVGAAAADLTRGMGLERYQVIDLRSGLVAGVHHDAPAALKDEIAVADDPVAAQARASLIPFIWQAGAGGAWRERHGAMGYRSGVAAASWYADGPGCVVLLSSSAEQVAAEHGATLLTYALMAAMTIGSTLRRLAPKVEVECPFTARELDCLLHALAGRSSKETARALGIEARTVHQYLERARARLGVTSSYAAATTALRYGWLDMQQASELAGLGSAAGAGHVG